MEHQISTCYIQHGTEKSLTNMNALDRFSGPVLILIHHECIFSITSLPARLQNILASENLTSHVWTHMDEQAWNQLPFYKACWLDKKKIINVMRGGKGKHAREQIDKQAQGRSIPQTRAIPYLESQKVRMEAPPAPCPRWLSWLSTKTTALSEGTKPQPSPQFLDKNTNTWSYPANWCIQRIPDKSQHLHSYFK